MDLVVVRMVPAVGLPAGVLGGKVLVPELPEGIRTWGKTGNEWDNEGRVSLYLHDATPAHLEAIAKQKGGQVLAVADDERRRELEAIRDAARTDDVAQIEYVEAYRRLTYKFEIVKRDEERKARRVEAAKRIARLLVIGGLSLVAQHYGPAGVSLALVLLHTDDFNRANVADINGQTMSDALGTWTSEVGAARIVSSQCEFNTGGACVYRDSAAAAVDEQECTVINRTATLFSGFGPAVRVQTGIAQGFMTYEFPGNTHVFIMTGGGAASSIGSGAGHSVANDVMGIHALGTTLTGKLNGSAVVMATDSNFATGACGFFADTVGCAFDDWTSYIASAPPPSTGYTRHVRSSSRIRRAHAP